MAVELLDAGVEELSVYGPGGAECGRVGYGGKRRLQGADYVEVGCKWVYGLERGILWGPLGRGYPRGKI